MPNNDSNKQPNKSNSSRRVAKIKKSERSGRASDNNSGSNKPVPKRVNSKGKIKNNKHPKLRIALRVFIILILLLCVIGAGVVAAMFFGLFGDDFEITKEELTVGVSNTIIVDKDGNEIANLSKDEKRKTIHLSEMPEYLPKAYVAIEDKRFYSHNGVDIKRTAGAVIGAVTGNSSYGGSSITQQLVKNITNDKARSGIEGVLRKMKEWSKAIQVERMITKDQILELYLNIIFVGGDNLHGVELAAKYYFNKSAKDLDLAQCAFLAGINNSPNKYNPFDTEKDHTNLIKERALTVLKEMKDQGYITNEEEYNAAVTEVEAGLKFEKGNTSSNSTYSYHTDATINQVVEQVMEEKKVTREFAEKYVYSSGLTIHSTENASIQARVEEEFEKSKYIVNGKAKNEDGSLKNEHSQAGLVTIEHTTGQVVAVGGELGSKYATGWNRGTQMVRQTGSAMKPIADVAPALEEKVITAATVYDDAKTDFSGYKPVNYNDFKGLINIRSFIETSQNIPAVKIMAELTPRKSMDYLKKMGITTLDDKKDETLSLSIGGLTNGISPLEMAAAYAMIANDGVYITPTFYTKVTDSSGNTVLTPNQEKTKVISEQNAYIARTIVEEPVKGGSGTARYCAVPGMETCAKTGTTDDNYDRWLCGMTPYYTTACWYGYDQNEKVVYNAGNPAGLIWSAIMKDIHKDLENKSFNKPSGIVEATVCRTTGCIATSSCTNTYKEIFTQDNMPQKCEGHGNQEICTDSGKIANEYCPNKKTTSYGGTVPKEKLKLWKASGGSSIGGKKVNEVCDIHKKPKEKEEPKNEVTNNAINNANSNKNDTSNGNNTNAENNTVNNKPKNDTNTGANTNTNETNNESKH